MPLPRLNFPINNQTNVDVNNYVSYTPEELAQDQYFIQWVNATDLAAENFWQNWLETYPFKRKDIEIARQIVLLTNQMADSDFSDDEMIELKSAIFEQIAQYETPSIWGRFRQNWAWVAVAASLAIGIGLWWQNTQLVSENTYLAQVNMAKKKYEIIESLNLNEEQKVVSLPDGSSIMLKKGARISYPESFDGDKREVYLTGEAFFEVAKDANKPFFVHANQVITKVLGTSFTIRAVADAPTVTVNVKTGRVAVFLANSQEDTQQAQTKKLEGLVLSPGERVVVEESNIGAVQAPKPFSETVSPNTSQSIEHILFEFNETHLRDVFARIEQVYHLKVEYNEHLMGNCPVTASLTDEPLNQKLHLICKAVRANYVLSEGKVVVSGAGCE